MIRPGRIVPVRHGPAGTSGPVHRVPKEARATGFVALSDSPENRHKAEKTAGRPGPRSHTFLGSADNRKRVIQDGGVT